MNAKRNVAEVDWNVREIIGTFHRRRSYSLHLSRLIKNKTLLQQMIRFDGMFKSIEIMFSCHFKDLCGMMLKGFGNPRFIEYIPALSTMRSLSIREHILRINSRSRSIEGTIWMNNEC